ncbi:uncharacterized protein [Mytilus edulis]|uniref:uncharacterized protein n=1 Tax=Mytilus edulis TaxID=6550 RepID=UPI0039F07699
MKILTIGLLLIVLIGIVLSKHQGSILSSMLKPLDFSIHLHITSEENQPKNDILHELGDFYKGKRTGPFRPHNNNGDNELKNDVLHELGDYFKGKRSENDYFYYFDEY